MTQVTTEYSTYDDDNIESMLSYCMMLRGTRSVASIVLELGWFTEAVCYGSIMKDDRAKEIHNTYKCDEDWYNPVTSYIRLFVKYCENEYGN